MFRECVFRSLFVFMVPTVVLCTGGELRAGEPSGQVQDPAAGRSAEYSLRIEADDEYLRSGARYTLSLRGKQIWTGKRPYALQDHVVTDKGWVAGVAYSMDARRPPGGGKRKSYLNVVILDPTGREILNDKSVRTDGDLISQGVYEQIPRAVQVLVDASTDRIIIRGRDDNTPGDSRLDFMWIFRLSTGERLARFRPATARSINFDPVRKILHTTMVKGTPFVLVHWYLSGAGARFALVGQDGIQIWGLDFNEDYVDLDASAHEDLRKYLALHPGILETDKPGQFSIRRFSENRRITFAVSPASDGDWAVDEVSRVEYVEPPKEVTPTPGD